MSGGTSGQPRRISRRVRRDGTIRHAKRTWLVDCAQPGETLFAETVKPFDEPLLVFLYDDARTLRVRGCAMRTDERDVRGPM